MIANFKTNKKQKYNNTVHLTRESSYSNKQQKKEKLRQNRQREREKKNKVRIQK
jgi:hypothetical protein